MDLATTIREQAHLARTAAAQLANLSAPVKNKILLAMADALLDSGHRRLEENQRDIHAGRKNGMSTAMLDRLLLTESRLEAMALGLRQVAALSDGQSSAPFKTDAGWVIVKRVGSRQVASGDETRRAQVRDTIGRRKLEDEWNRFLREMRGEAYVDVRGAQAAAAPATSGG